MLQFPFLTAKPENRPSSVGKIEASAGTEHCNSRSGASELTSSEMMLLEIQFKSSAEQSSFLVFKKRLYLLRELPGMDFQ